MTTSKKIENPKTVTSQKSAVSDADLLSTAIATERNLDSSYTYAMHEASHRKFYSLLFDMLKETSQQHRKLVELQFQHGWSSLTPASSEEVEALKQEFTDYRQQLK